MEVVKLDPQSIESKIAAWWEGCSEEEPPTKPGLALAMGYCDVNSMVSSMAKLKEDDSRYQAYKKAITMIEDDYSKRVLKKNAVGSMFMLKASHGYRDNSNLDSKADAVGTVTLAIGGIGSADKGSAERDDKGS